MFFHGTIFYLVFPLAIFGSMHTCLYILFFLHVFLRTETCPSDWIDIACKHVLIKAITEYDYHVFPGLKVFFRDQRIMRKSKIKRQKTKRI